MYFYCKLDFIQALESYEVTNMELNFLDEFVDSIVQPLECKLHACFHSRAFDSIIVLFSLHSAGHFSLRTK